MASRRRSDDSDECSAPPPKRSRYNLRMTRMRKKYMVDDNDEERCISDDEANSRNKVLEVKEAPGKSLRAASVDMQKEENEDAHHTSEYERNYTILRRGQIFTFSITFDREIDSDHDEVILQFTNGTRPEESKGTVVRIPLNLDGKSKSTNTFKSWTCVATVSNSKEITCQVVSPPDGSIGYYDLFIESRLKDEEDSETRKKFGKFLILFNPWCEDDVVYIEDDAERKEYVMNTSGRIWQINWSSGLPWNFGQFDSPCLEVALQLLGNDCLSKRGYSNPIVILRSLSRWSNSCDNAGRVEGVLQGNWSGNYSGGNNPSSWTGSVKILRQYYETEESVKYGQCWVFSGIVTTLGRALGIPTRSVTNFDSAHDNDGSMTIDSHYNEDGAFVDEMNDSVWNFHVWNEAWLKRRDLPDGYGGWQAFDGTPQESSEGLMQCGPAPVKAIKNGDVFLPFDGKFIYAEVNGDNVTWLVKKNGDMEVIDVKDDGVGTNIVTKAVGTIGRHDITRNYKYPEGSKEIQEVTDKVLRYSSRRKDFNIEKQRDFEFNIIQPDTIIGNDFELKILVKNLTSTIQYLSINATLMTTHYTGAAGRRVKSCIFDEEIGPHDEIMLPLQVESKEYIRTMNNEGWFSLVLMCKNADGRRYITPKKFCLVTPELKIEGPDTLVFKEEVTVFVKFENNTGLTLTNLRFIYEGSGLTKDGEIQSNKVLKPGQKVSEKIILKPRYLKERELDVTLSSDQVDNINGSKVFIVQR